MEEFRQQSPGKPGPDTKYVRKIKEVPYLIIRKNHEMIRRSESVDGTFPLTTNTRMDAKETLQTYKYQPKIEKRFSHMKSNHQVALVFLKKTDPYRGFDVYMFFE